MGSSARTIVRYDGRGTGLSQRDVTEYSLETFVADLEAVVEALGAERLVLHGINNTCPVAIEYAVRHPERVSELILWCPLVDGSVHADNPMLIAGRQLAATNWEMFTETIAHSLFGWEESRHSRQFAALIRAGNSPETILPMVAAMDKLNVWAQLPRVRCRTLVLHRPETNLLPPGTAERVTATIPDAELALFEGPSTAPFIGDWRAISRTIGRFLEPAQPSTQRGPARTLRLLAMKTEALSPREREIVGLVAHGLTNREIAEELYLAVKTVENHIGRILVKLDLRSRTQLAAYAVEHGLADRPA
jgi:DNA-binding CsgD family transcriptional regulator/pimeloyl-ACP methyl ester carboxylesterase